MQSKGAIRFVAILLILACLWQLSFTLVSALQGNRAKKAAENQVALTEQSAAFARVPEADKAYYLDSVRKDAERSFTDSLMSEKVYFGYTYKDVRSKEINLGLLADRVQIKSFVRLGNAGERGTLLGECDLLFSGLLGPVALKSGHKGEGELPQAGQDEQNRYKSDSTFALHDKYCF